MSLSQSNSNPVNNKLLAKVPREEYDRLLPHLKLVSLSSEQVLYEANELIDYAYFPLTGVSSLLNIMQDGQGIEAATVGNEGMIGIPLLLGTTQTPNMAISQIPGDALQMKADVFQREVYWGCSLHSLLLRYTQTLINQISQTAACNRLHPVEKRCCRWLLMTSDRVESDEFFLTPEVLSRDVRSAPHQ
jgi:CRP-like cAMP-binding protein